MAQSWYEILGVANDASEADIRAAYESKLKAIQESPAIDKNQLMVLKEVYQALSNPTRRAMYEQSLLRAAQPKLRAAYTESEATPASHLAWIKWLLVILIILVLGFWWYSSRKKPPIVTQPPVVVSSGTDQQAMPENAAQEKPQQPMLAVAPINSGQERNAEQIFTELSVSIARINVSNASGRPVSIGSGVVIAREKVITNCHVTQGGDTIQVKIDKQSYSGRVELEDRDFDLCRLHVAGLNAPAVRLGQGQNLRSGQKVFAIGAPHGLDLTISDGIVSALREMPGGKVIQTTAPVSPGSSGGGLFDTLGNLVGVVTFQHSKGQNLNFAVPAEWINEMRQRTSNHTVGTLTRPQGPEAGSGQDNASAPEQRILGQWDCRGSIHTVNMELHFRSNGQVITRRNGKEFGGNYTLRNKTLRLTSADVLEGNLEDFRDSRFIVNFGQGYRMVCDRK
jgi:serine protease Do